MTGNYRRSNYVFLNGKQVATDPTSLKAWIEAGPEIKDNDLIRFVNIAPYARKLERYGVTKQRSKTKTRNSTDKKKRSGPKILSPNGVYFLATRAIGRKYKKNSSIKFGFIKGSGLGIVGSFAKRKGERKSSGTYLYPSITIVVKGGGLR